MFGYCCGTGFSIKLLALWFCSRVDQGTPIDWTLIRRAIQNPNLLIATEGKPSTLTPEAKAVSMLIYAIGVVLIWIMVWMEVLRV